MIAYSYNVIDSNGGSVPQTATITIVGVNDQPTVNSPVTASSTEDDSTFTVDLLSGANDPDTNDTLAVDGLILTDGDDGGLSVRGNSLEIDPSVYNHLAVGQSEVITYGFNVIDGNGGSVRQSATITIVGVNDQPTINGPVTASSTEDDSTFTVDLLSGAGDPDNGDAIDVDGLTLAHGNDSGVTIATNSLLIDPSAYNHLAAGESEVITYSFNVVDTHGGSVPQTAIITIAGINDQPAVGNPINASATEDDMTFTVDLLSGAHDPDTNDTLAVDGLMLTDGDDGGVSVIGNAWRSIPRSTTTWPWA